MKTPLGRRVHELRALHKLSQKQLAGLVRVDPSYISQIEGGLAQRPSDPILRALAQALGQSFEDFLALVTYPEGRLPPKQQPSEQEDLLLHYFRNFTQEERESLLDFARVRYQRKRQQRRESKPGQGDLTA